MFFFNRHGHIFLHEAKRIEGEWPQWKWQVVIVAVLQTFQLQQCQTHLGSKNRQPNKWLTALKLCPLSSKGTVVILQTLIGYLIPVGWTWLLLDLLLNPLQIDCDKSLKALAVTGLRCEGPTVIHQSVHPVFIDELKQAEKHVLH